jgi:adenylate cyclase
MPLAAVKTMLVDNRGLVVDRMAARIVQSIPRYSLLDARDLRENLEGFFDDLMEMIDAGQSGAFASRVLEVSQRRIAQGFSPSDYLHAILLTFPTLREVLRRVGPTNEPSLAAGFAELEEVLHQLAATSADLFIQSVTHSLESKNRELNRLNQKLKAQERSVALEAHQATRELEHANEFNRRVIESLSSGLLVVDTSDVITLFSSRVAEIIELAPETVLGKNVYEALAPLGGLDVGGLIRTVRTMGRLPLTRIRLTLPSGRHRTVFLRAGRMFDPQGAPEGTVVVVDDVTERELLVDSFSRYVSRDLVQRLLARVEPLDMGGERKVCTVLFADLRGFTALAETLSPEQLHELLNEYFRVMIEGITQHGGFIDKFVGDNVMALFTGEPRASALAAAHASLAIKRGIADLSGRRLLGGLAPIDVGIGLNTGDVVIGNVGTEERMDFTAVGDPVNVADRLQGLAREGQIFLGERTATLIDGIFDVDDRGEQPLRGRSQPVRVFELRIGAPSRQRR